MQHQLPTIDFKSEAEVRSQAEHRRTEEVAELLKAFFASWTPRLRQSARPILEGVQQAHRPVAAGRR
jgi:hypothetical protein